MKRKSNCMKNFNHVCQPYGTIKLTGATFSEVEIPQYIPNVGFRGTRKTNRVTGIVVSSMFVSLLGGVAVTSGHNRYAPGSRYTIDDVRDWEWEQGYKITVAM